MVKALTLLKEENRSLTSLFPPIAFGYISIKGYFSPCDFLALPVEWVYTGLPPQVYVGATVVSALISAGVLSLTSAGKTPFDTKDLGLVDLIWSLHTISEIAMVISLLMRWCKIDLALWTMLLVTVMLWLVPILQNRFTIS